MKRFPFLAGILLAMLLAPGAASAGVATAGAVLLDPYDPVPEIQFRHYGGYGYGGCDIGCGGYDYDSCGSCYRHRHHYYRCDDGCRRHDDCRDRCREGYDGERYADRDGGDAEPCTQGRCYDAEHYERRWHNGDREGVEWYDRGRKEKTVDGHEHGFYGHGEDWHDDDDDGPGPGPGPDPGPPHGGH
jgi:hypothetical protein